MDGAMGTMVLSYGFPLSGCIEHLNLTAPKTILKIHGLYLKAGADTLVANTFGANRIRLSTHRLETQLATINRTGVRLAKQAAKRHPKRKIMVLASIGPLGRKIPEEKAQRLFEEQVLALEKKSPDGYLIETMTALSEAKAAVSAVRRRSRALILACCSFSKKTTKRDLEKASRVLRKAGADVIGLNCGTGPAALYPLARILRKIDPGPLCIRPAAGLPGHISSPRVFAGWVKKFRALGFTWIGGCCGTTPEHIFASAL